MHWNKKYWVAGLAYINSYEMGFSIFPEGNKNEANWCSKNNQESDFSY
jgi:hypothetical protein